MHWQSPILILHNLERFRALNRNEDVTASDIIGRWVQGAVIFPEEIMDIEFLDSKPTAKVTGVLVYDIDDGSPERVTVTETLSRGTGTQQILQDVIGGHRSVLRTDEVRTQPFETSRIRGLVRRGEETTVVEEPPVQPQQQPFNLLRALHERTEKYGVPVDPDDFYRDDDSPPPRRRGPRPPPLVIPPSRRPLRIEVPVPMDFSSPEPSPVEEFTLFPSLPGTYLSITIHATGEFLF